MSRLRRCRPQDDHHRCDQQTSLQVARHDVSPTGPGARAETTISMNSAKSRKSRPSQPNVRRPQKLTRHTKYPSNAWSIKHAPGFRASRDWLPAVRAPEDRTSRRGSAACARFRLGSPPFHEPEHHTDVADSLAGQRMRSVSEGWLSLNGSPLRAEVVEVMVFNDGIEEKPAA